MIYLNDGIFIKRKIILVKIYKYPNYVKYNKTIYYKEDCSQRYLKNILKNISNRIRVKKKLKIT